MKFLERIKTYLDKHNHELAVKIARSAFSYDVVDDKVYITCHGVAVKSMDTSVSVKELMKEIDILTENAIEFEWHKPSF